ncbi:MAG: cytochrome c [Anaerolineae bacterium]|nr:cytochrome c [Anaerolineae bacterium]
MKHAIPILVLVAGMVVGLTALWTAQTIYAQGGEEGEGHGGEFAPLQGAAVYAEFCQACHGPQGESIGTGPAFAAIAYDAETSRQAVAEGLDSDAGDGIAMPAYAQVGGGPLTEAQLDAVLAYMETWETGETPPLPEPNIEAGVDRVPDYFGDPQAGAVLYATYCYGCHGERGRGRIPPDFPALRVTDDTPRLIREGPENDIMPGFGVDSGGPLDDQQVEDLTTYLASWALEDDEDRASAKGVNTLLMIMGIAAILMVGGAYMARTGNNG